MSELYKRIKDVSTCIKTTVYNLHLQINREEREVSNIMALDMPEEFKKTLLKKHLEKIQELRCKLNSVIGGSCSQDQTCPTTKTKKSKLKF
tara:strand:+ start:137 stop:409 length:273 start_codon:yes stop_codon:yes gene_type:complete